MKLYKDKYFLGLSIASAIIALVFYYITKAPTVSFWDCGEFIATSYVMGIPHPPGNPLFVILGRLFTMLPIASSIAVRVNLISVLSSAISVFMAFWLILRLAIGRRDQIPEGYARLGLGIGAFAGSLIMGLSYTFWSNAVEAEVYGLSMLLMLILTHLSLQWARDQDRPGNDRLLILISYLLWLSLGIHMTTFILTMPLVLYLAYIDYIHNRFERWPIWLSIGLFVLYAVPLQTQIVAIVGIDISAFELESFFVIMGLLFITAMVMVSLTRLRAAVNAQIWILTLMVLLSGAIGYSTQVFIPVRAAQKPSINENDPSNWPRFKSFLERKQYGQESMITRMFHRRASWENQFISHPSFGLFGQLTEQYASPDAKLNIYESKSAGDVGGFSFGFHLWLVYIIFLGVGGILESIKRSPPEGTFIVLTMLLCTVGLVFYLNFSDGTYNKLIAPQAEVRDRDYFYTPGFMYFAMLIGIGLSAFLEWLGTKSEAPATRRPWLKAGFGLAVFLTLILAGHTAAANFRHNDRRGNFIPWNYADNILESCDKGAVLFTNGDNDTFPLWYLQEVEKIRTDVRVANLSLLNTPWYIHQLKDQLKIPIKLSYDEIEDLHAARVEGYDRIWRIQDQMVREIITNSQANGWQPAVYFAMTVSPDNRLGLDDHLILEGMVYRVVDSTGKDRVDTGVGQRVLGDPAHFRGITDTQVRKDDNDVRLISNYIAAMFQVVEAYEKKGWADSAMAMAETAVKLGPAQTMWQARAYLAKMYALNNKFDKIDALVDELDSASSERILLAVGQDFIMSKNNMAAEIILRKALTRFPASFPALNNYVVICYQKGDTASALTAINKFRQDNSQNALLLNSLKEMVDRLEEMPNISPEAK